MSLKPNYKTHRADTRNTHNSPPLSSSNGGDQHQTCSVHTNHLAYRTFAPACLECHQHALLGFGNGFHNTHDETFDWFQAVQLIDHQLLKAGVRLFSSPQIFSSKLLSSYTCSSTSIIHLIFFSTGLASLLIFINLLQLDFVQYGHCISL